ncbi:hypothetical protein SteCoe_31221 [Stentor coeruleus]|uniref:FHA domain-containing protein n=1 Tax=Stentor coeruleus TaxID=5963 RepID=A0A1R2B1S8_9CILI|nr:hypothetical protein SteCoe_31221 [Stentor coeruleus]
MERLQKFFLLFGRKCCFYSDYMNNEEIKAEGENSEEVSHSKIFNEDAESEKNEAILKITVLESNNIQQGKVFCIYPNGLKENENVKTKDRCIYASLYQMEDGKAVNDMLLTQRRKGRARKDFVVQHKGNDYYIKSIDQGLGTYISLAYPFALVIGKIYIISIGNIHMAVSIENNTRQRIFIQVVDGPNKNDKFRFLPRDSPIYIGRLSDCKIKLDDNCLSKYHCYMIYNERWFIQDGDGKNMSTNGTWMFVEEFCKVYHGMIFKVGETLMRADVKN